jgi:hypothetical protein
MLFRTMNLSAYVAASIRAAGSMRELGPCVLVALIVPGGCLIALAIWAFRHRASLMDRLRRRRSGFGLNRIRLNRIRLDRITAICEATHTWLGAHRFAHPASAMVVLRAGSAAESQRQERRRSAEQCVRS